VRSGIVLIALACVVAAAPACRPAPPVRPNLVLITVDGVRPDSLVCYRGEAALGDEACALGDPGALYEWAFATAPAGAPTAASVLTSTYPSQHGVYADPSTFLRALGPPTLAETLRDAGYSTAAFVSSPELNRSRHLDRGFDLYDDRDRATPDAEARPVGLRARAWTSGASPPWFAWVHFADVHGPLAAAGPGATDATYAQAMRRLDRQLSQLVAVLDSGDEPPGILLVGLHGQHRGGAAAPGSALALERLRVPLLWRSPRAGAGSGVGRRITRPVSAIDVAPTLLQAAGLRAPASFEGMPLPHSDGVGGAAERVLFAEHPTAVAVIQGSALAVLPRALVPPPGGPSPSGWEARYVRLPVAGGSASAGSGPPPAEHAARLADAVAGLPTRWRGEPAEAEDP